MEAEIFGWSCIVTYRPYGSPALAEKEIHRRGNSSVRLRGAARRMHGFVRYRDLIAYTRDEWAAMFGMYTETGRRYYARGK